MGDSYYEVAQTIRQVFDHSSWFLALGATPVLLDELVYKYAQITSGTMK